MSSTIEVDPDIRPDDVCLQAHKVRELLQQKFNSEGRFRPFEETQVTRLRLVHLPEQFSESREPSRRSDDATGPLVPISSGRTGRHHHRRRLHDHEAAPLHRESREVATGEYFSRTMFSGDVDDCDLFHPTGPVPPQRKAVIMMRHRAHL